MTLCITDISFMGMGMNVNVVMGMGDMCLGLCVCTVSIHPSIHPSIYLSINHWARGGVKSGQVASQSQDKQTTIHTHIDRLNLWSVAVIPGENPRRNREN